MEYWYISATVRIRWTGNGREMRPTDKRGGTIRAYTEQGTGTITVNTTDMGGARRQVVADTRAARLTSRMDGYYLAEVCQSGQWRPWAALGDDYEKALEKSKRLAKRMNLDDRTGGAAPRATMAQHVQAAQRPWAGKRSLSGQTDYVLTDWFAGSNPRATQVAPDGTAPERVLTGTVLTAPCQPVDATVLGNLVRPTRYRQARQVTGTTPRARAQAAKVRYVQEVTATR